VNAWSWIEAAGDPPTEAKVATLTHRSRRFVRTILARLVRLGLMSKGAPVCRNNRLQYVPRCINWSLLPTEPIRSSTREPIRVKSLSITSFRKADTSDTPKDAAHALSQALSDQKPKAKTSDDAFLVAFRVLAFRLADPLLAAVMVMWIAFRALKAGSVPRTASYYVRSALQFTRQWPEYQQDAILAFAEERLLKVCPTAKGLIRKIYAMPVYKRAESQRGPGRWAEGDPWVYPGLGGWRFVSSGRSRKRGLYRDGNTSEFATQRKGRSTYLRRVQ